MKLTKLLIAAALLDPLSFGAAVTQDALLRWMDGSRKSNFRPGRTPSPKCVPLRTRSAETLVRGKILEALAACPIMRDAQCQSHRPDPSDGMSLRKSFMKACRASM